MLAEYRMHLPDPTTATHHRNFGLLMNHCCIYVKNAAQNFGSHNNAGTISTVVNLYGKRPAIR
jgi:hypothetical protein